jgi:ribonuclease VapC
MAAVADASALLAYLQSEPGEDIVAEAMAGGLVMSTVNVAEVLSKLADAGATAEGALTTLIERGVLAGTVTTEPFSDGDALNSAKLRERTISAGLSLADRACLALGMRLGLPVLTADRVWASLDIGVVVQVIR